MAIERITSITITDRNTRQAVGAANEGSYDASEDNTVIAFDVQMQQQGVVLNNVYSITALPTIPDVAYRCFDSIENKCWFRRADER